VYNVRGLYNVKRESIHSVSRFTFRSATLAA